jgi:hypothetical protein
MSFSFNQGQSEQSGSFAQGAVPSAPVAAVPGAVPGASPSIPDSPFLFIQQREQTVSIGAYIQIILLVITILSVVVSVAIFGYSMYLASNIDAKKAEIAQRDASFKEYPFEDMKRLSNRFAALDKILKEYVSARSPLKLLEDVVEKQVYFDNFALGRNTGGSGFTMNFVVITTNYRALIQQLEALNLSQYSKVLPQPKVGELADNNNNLLRVQISAPVFVQGVLSDDVVFVPPVATSTQQLPVSGGVQVGTTTP